MSGSAQRDYGRLARIGVGTPQANPTVEAEFGILLPRACSLHVTRLTSDAADPAARLRDYLLRLDDYLAAYDSLRPDAFGFACTASSYLLGAAEEQRLLAEAAGRRGYPVESATRAIRWALERCGARRLALLAPYPEAVVEAAGRYWTAAGFEVVHAARIATRSADTRTIYELDSGSLGPALDRVPAAGVDAVLVTGTGLPSLAVLRDHGGDRPLLSSNFCLAGRLLELAGHGDWLEPGAPGIRGWRQRLAEAGSLSP